MRPWVPRTHGSMMDSRRTGYPGESSEQQAPGSRLSVKEVVADEPHQAHQRHGGTVAGRAGL